jgi:hypothetical protein
MNGQWPRGSSDHRIERGTSLFRQHKAAPRVPLDTTPDHQHRDCRPGHPSPLPFRPTGDAEKQDALTHGWKVRSGWHPVACSCGPIKHVAPGRRRSNIAEFVVPIARGRQGDALRGAANREPSADQAALSKVRKARSSFSRLRVRSVLGIEKRPYRPQSELLAPRGASPLAVPGIGRHCVPFAATFLPLATSRVCCCECQHAPGIFTLSLHGLATAARCVGARRAVVSDDRWRRRLCLMGPSLIDASDGAGYRRWFRSSPPWRRKITLAGLPTLKPLRHGGGRIPHGCRCGHLGL